MEWMTKKRAGRNGNINSDILLSHVCRNSKPSTSIRFTKKAVDKVAKSRYVIFAIQGTRLYFAEASEKNGWKLSKSTNGESVFVKVYESIIPAEKIEPGNYNLEWDYDKKLYYIDNNHNLSKMGLIWSRKGDRK